MKVQVLSPARMEKLMEEEEKITSADAKLLLYQLSDIIEVAEITLEHINNTESDKVISVLKLTDGITLKLMDWIENRGWEFENNG